jgi:hypothetical protein
LNTFQVGKNLGRPAANLEDSVAGRFPNKSRDEVTSRCVSAENALQKPICDGVRQNGAKARGDFCHRPQIIPLHLTAPAISVINSLALNKLDHRSRFSSPIL